MEQAITLDDVRRAWHARDPSLAELVVALTGDDGPRRAVRSDALTWQKLRIRHQDRAFLKLDPEQRRQRRIADFAALEAPDAEAPLPDRFGLHEILGALWQDGGAWARMQLLEMIATVPLQWGPWRALKHIFKEAEARGDWEIYGALAARFDTEYAAGRKGLEVRRPTLRYLVRRAWRQLRLLGVRLPAAYPDAAAELLRHYPQGTVFARTWIANHVFFHELDDAYSRSRFKRTSYRRGVPALTQRAFGDAWRRTPRPLFSLLERARSETVRAYAAEALKADFRTQLREVEPAWVVRLLGVHSASVDRFVVWLLENVPRFEPGAFRELGLHDAVLGLLDSDAEEAATWGATYARTHARDLSLDRLITLANSQHAAVRKLARDLLRDRDPRKDVGLEGWGRLLGTRHGHRLAVEALQEHFGARELGLDWFTDRLLSGDRQVVEFAVALLPKVHPDKKVPTSFWSDLLDHPRVDSQGARVALDALASRDLADVDTDVLRRALLNGTSRGTLQGWVREGRLPAPRLGGDFFKALAYHPTWEADPWIRALIGSDRAWAHGLTFDERLSEWALGLLGDPRTFSADDLGFEWLFQLVQRTEPRYHRFAVETLTRSFLPSHFAEEGASGTKKAEEAAPAGDVEIDLQGQTFLFTGKLATMSRGEASKKVTGAKGKNASGVSATLDYLVIGDEGSPLYGGGRKGSKQVKAEKLIEEGSALKIISETAFLQMLAGETVEVDEDAAMAGAERLWEMATSPGPVDDPLRNFALHYLRHHHAEIHMAETDRPLDPGAELPDAFLTFERATRLVSDERRAVRDLGLAWMRFELARWAPDMSGIVALSELPHPEVRALVELALTAPERREHRRYRLDPAILTPEAVYRFCESLDAATRALGMKLIALNPRLAVPEELFRLTESPDRQVRAFVVRQLWGLYRDKHTSSEWKAPVRDKEEPVPGRPDAWPAEPDDIRAFFRRTLFGIPPARMPKKGDSSGLKPLPARRAKLALIEVCRDLALEEQGFAERVTPLFTEFLSSRGKAESEACLVALTRIRARWGNA